MVPSMRLPAQGVAEPPAPRTRAPRPSRSYTQIGGVLKGAGETFGVAALVLGAPVRQYGMRANDRSLFIRIAFDDFQPFLNSIPKLNTSLLYSTKLFLVQRYSTFSSSIFHSFNGEELIAAAKVADFRKLSPGEVGRALAPPAA